MLPKNGQLFVAEPNYYARNSNLLNCLIVSSWSSRMHLKRQKKSMAMPLNLGTIQTVCMVLWERVLVHTCRCGIGLWSPGWGRIGFISLSFFFKSLSFLPKSERVLVLFHEFLAKFLDFLLKNGKKTSCKLQVCQFLQQIIASRLKFYTTMVLNWAS